MMLSARKLSQSDLNLKIIFKGKMNLKNLNVLCHLGYWQLIIKDLPCSCVINKERIKPLEVL